MSKSSANRREFLKTGSAVAAAGVVAGAGLAPQTSRGGYHVFGSDTIRVGVIGSGGRGSGAMADALNAQSGNVEITAVGDLFADRPAGSLGGLKERYKDRIKVTEDTTFIGFDAYQKVLDTDCQTVILATPPGFRPLHFEAAVKAGKNVFMEKPVAVDAPGVQRVLKASEEAKRKGLSVQVGLQRRHERAYMETLQRLKDGIIGDIVAARVYWNQGFLWVAGRRPEQTELEYQIRNWLYFNWLSGDHLVEQHIHNLDVINWLLDDYPVKAEGMGGRQVRTGPQHGEIFDHHAIEYTYANGVKMFSQCRQIAGCWNEVSEHVHGTKGSCDIAAGRIFDLNGKEIFRTEGSRGGHAQEHVDMYADMARGLIPNEGEYGAKSTMTAIMGRMSTYSGKAIRWEDAMASQRKLADVDSLTSLQDKAPVQPLENGEYEIAVPGEGWEKVLDWNPDKRG
jgi:predicted dehydrogenase